MIDAFEVFAIAALNLFDVLVGLARIEALVSWLADRFDRGG